MKKIFLIGYYGYDNLGDEILLASITNYLLQSKDIQVKVLSYNAQSTKEVHKVESVSRSKGLELLKQIISSDVLVSGGGSILQDSTSSKSLYYYMGILMLGKLFGKKVYLLGNGFGPINKKLNRALLKILIKSIDGIVTRDQDAYDAFMKYSPKEIYNGVDCVFLRDLSYQTVNELKFKEKRPYVAISLRPWKNETEILKSVDLCIDKLDALGYDTVLVPMKAPDDIKVCRHLLEKGNHVSMLDHKIENVETCLQNATFTIGMRLHALILSALANKPFIAISYDPKVTSFTEQVKQVHGPDTQNIEGQALINSVELLLSHFDLYEENLEAQVNQIKDVANEQMQVLMKWLNNK